MILPDMPNLAEIAFLQHQAAEELETQARILKARVLDAGYYDSDLAEQTATYLIGGDPAAIEGINLMRIVLRTVLRRVDVQAVTSNNETYAAWLGNIWEHNEMDVKQTDVHRWAERDGEAFVIVEFDPAAERPWEPGQMGMPRVYVHERFVSPEVTFGEDVGSGQGCKAHYRNGDYNQPLEMVSKRWVETTYEDGEAIVRQRMTLYIARQPQTAARIEKYVMNDSGEWEELTETRLTAEGTEEQESWPIWWTQDGTETGVSLPLPVIHFRNEEMEPVTRPVWGIQNGMDQAWSSLLGGMTLTAHQIFTFFGWTPTTDGKTPRADGANLIKITPRTFIGAPDKKPGDASMDVVQPANPAPVINAMDKMAIYCAFVAGLPINNFIISKAVASSSTLRQGEADLVAHVNALKRIWGRAWARVLTLTAVLDNLYGGGAWPVQELVKVQWAPAETVNVEGRNAEALARKATDVPAEFIWRDVWGYDEEAIDKMQAQATDAEESATGGE